MPMKCRATGDAVVAQIVEDYPIIFKLFCYLVTFLSTMTYT